MKDKEIYKLQHIVEIEWLYNYKITIKDGNVKIVLKNELQEEYGINMRMCANNIKEAIEGMFTTQVEIEDNILYFNTEEFNGFCTTLKKEY